MFYFYAKDRQGVIHLDNIYITKHAYKRVKERMGLTKAAAEKMAKKAYTDGIKHSQTKGQLHKYFTKVYLNYRNSNNTRLYGEKIFVFNDNVLITVLELPNDLKKNCKKMIKNEK